MDEVKSAPLKAEPNFFKPASPEARAVLEDVVNEGYAWFVGMVSERRDIDLARAREIADGRIYTGSQALEKGLIDAVGGEKQAVAWLESERQVAKDLPIRDWQVEKPINDLSFSGAIVRNFMGFVAATILSDLGGTLNGYRDGVAVDGLLSVWQARPQIKDNLPEGASR